MRPACGRDLYDSQSLAKTWQCGSHLWDADKPLKLSALACHLPQPRTPKAFERLTEGSKCTVLQGYLSKACLLTGMVSCSRPAIRSASPRRRGPPGGCRMAA